MSDKYFTVNIRAYLDKDEPTYIGEESLYDLLSDFSCPKNPDVEYFLLHNAWCCIIKVDTLFSRILIYNHNQYENRRKTYGTESKIL